MDNNNPKANSILEELKSLQQQRCFACGGRGHAAHDCPTNAKLDNFSGIPKAGKVLKLSVVIVKQYLKSKKGTQSRLQPREIGRDGAPVKVVDVDMSDDEDD